MLPCFQVAKELSYYKLTDSYPIEFMYGIFTYIWLIFYAKSVGKYTVRPMDPAAIGGGKPPPSGCLDSFLCRSISSTVSAIGNESTKLVPICGVAPHNEMSLSLNFAVVCDLVSIFKLNLLVVSLPNSRHSANK